jgi:hypothetical protein
VAAAAAAANSSSTTATAVGDVIATDCHRTHCISSMWQMAVLSVVMIVSRQHTRWTGRKHCLRVCVVYDLAMKWIAVMLDCLRCRVMCEMKHLQSFGRGPHTVQIIRQSTQKLLIRINVSFYFTHSAPQADVGSGVARRRQHASVDLQ